MTEAIVLPAVKRITRGVGVEPFSLRIRCQEARIVFYISLFKIYYSLLATCVSLFTFNVSPFTLHS